MNILLNF